jgi:hypothetical protein
MDNQAEDARRYVPHILDCAHAMNAGRIEEAWESFEKFKDCRNALAKAVGARLLLHNNNVPQARQLLLDAICLVGENKKPTAQYIVEYSKVFLVDFSKKQDLIFQIRNALSLKPSQAIFKCLPLFEDLDHLPK